MGSVIKFLKETYGKQSLVDALRAGGWKALLDGNLEQTTIVHGPGAVLVGQDKYGNKYYERMSEQFGRHRWVVYANLDWPSGQDPSTIPSEWHGWINHVTDECPPRVRTPLITYELGHKSKEWTEEGFRAKQNKMAIPIFAIDHVPNKTGTPDAYQPKGSWFNTQKRNWRKYQAWEPPQTG